MAASNDPQSGSSPSFDWKAFSQKTWVVIVAGLALPPVGMILAWLKQDWMHRTKWIAIGAFGLLLIGRMQAARDSGLRDGSESSDPPIEMQTVDETSADFAEGYRIAMESKAMTPEERGRFLVFTVEPQIPSKADPAAFRRGMGKAFSENDSSATETSSLSEQEQSTGQVPVEKPISPVKTMVSRDRLTQGWFESDGDYKARLLASSERIIAAVLSQHYGRVSKVEIKPNRKFVQKLGIEQNVEAIATKSWETSSLSGKAQLESGGTLYCVVFHKGNVLEWVSATSEYWATKDAARFWDRDGQQLSADDFCKRWYQGKSLIDIRQSQNQSGQRMMERNQKAFKQALERVN